MSGALKAKPVLKAPLRVSTVACALWLTLAQTACSDVGPTQDLPQVDAAQMMQTQLLAALNDLGREPHLGKRWRYASQANCELAISDTILVKSWLTHLEGEYGKPLALGAGDPTPT